MSTKHLAIGMGLEDALETNKNGAADSPSSRKEDNAPLARMKPCDGANISGSSSSDLHLQSTNSNRATKKRRVTKLIARHHEACHRDYSNGACTATASAEYTAATTFLATLYALSYR